MVVVLVEFSSPGIGVGKGVGMASMEEIAKTVTGSGVEVGMVLVASMEEIGKTVTGSGVEVGFGPGAACG